MAQTVTIDPVGAVTAVEGNNLTITCTDGVNGGNTVLLRENGTLLTGDSAPPNEVTGMVNTFQLPVVRAQSGNRYDCQSLRTGIVSPVITLTVTCKWNGKDGLQSLIHVFPEWPSYVYIYRKPLVE